MTDEVILWQKTRKVLEDTLSPTLIKICFAKTKLISVEKNGDINIVVGCPNGFLKEQVEKRCGDSLLSAFEKVVGEKVHLKLEVVDNQSGDLETPSNNQVNRLGAATNGQATNFKKYTFDNFVVGESNRLAYSASLAICSNPGSVYNPLFIWGGTGLGKTHLLRAMAAKLSQESPGLKISYKTTEAFTNEFVDGLATGQIKLFRERYRKLGVLLIDDVHFLSGKTSTQDAFFHTFNELYAARCQIVLTSDKHPSEVGGLEQRLVSRFLGGLTVDIAPPELELRMAILSRKAVEANLNLEPQSLEFLAGLVTNPREIEGVVATITQAVKLGGQPTPETIKSLFTKSQNRIRTTPKQVVAAVAKFYGLKASEIIGAARKKELVKARQMVMFLLRNELGLSFDFIGQLLGGKDHSTIIHGVGAFKRKVEEGTGVREDLFEVKRLLSF